MERRRRPRHSPKGRRKSLLRLDLVARDGEKTCGRCQYYVVSPRSELGLMPNGSEDDLPCQEQHANYRACEGFKALKTCKECVFFHDVVRRAQSKVPLPCQGQPRSETDLLCPHYRKADRALKERHRAPLHALG